MTARASYAGVDLGGAASYAWGVTSGPAPQVTEWEVSATRAEELAQRVGTPGELVLTGERTSFTAREVWLLEILPGALPTTRRLRLADRRWLFPRAWVYLQANVRRVSGDRFLLEDGGPPEVAAIAEDVRWAPHSLYPPGGDTGRPWTAREVLRYVCDALGVRLIVPDPLRLAEQEILDLEIDAAGDAALSQALALIPGADVWLTPSGDLVLRDALGAVAGDVGQRLARPTTRGPTALRVARDRLRPRQVNVLFTPEVEVRFDFTEGGSVTPGDPSLTNEVPVPDGTLTVGGVELARGSLVQIDALMAAWGPFGFRDRALTVEILRKRGFDRKGLEVEFANDPRLLNDPELADRVHAVLHHWRRTLRVDRTFWGLIEAVRAIRAAIVNPETGTRAPSPVFCDYVRHPSIRALARAADQNTTLGWSARGWANLLADAKRAPARVRVADARAGVLRIEFENDADSIFDATVPGYAAVVPDARIGESNRTLVYAQAQWPAVELESGFRLATILTVIPASPGLTRFHRQEVLPTPRLVHGACAGPPLTVRVPASLLTARYAWDDAQRTEILAAVRGKGAYPRALLLNNVDVQDVAEAVAAAAWAADADGVAGGVEVDLDPTLAPQGPLAEVRHALAGGAVTSSVRFAGGPRPADLWRFLPPSTRRAILGAVVNDEGRV